MAFTYDGICGFETGTVDAEGHTGFAGFPGSGATVQSTIKRSGQYALRCNPVTTGIAYGPPICGHNGDSSITNVWQTTHNVSKTVYRCAVYVDTAPSASEDLLTVMGITGGVKLVVRIDENRKLSVYDADGTTLRAGPSSYVVPLQTWVVLQVYHSTPNYRVRADGTSVLNGTNSTSAGSHGSLVCGKVVNRNGSGYDIYFDDVAVGNGADGDVVSVTAKIARLDPDGNSATDTAWAASAGGKNECVDDLASQADHDIDSTYINSSTNTARYSATLQSCASKSISGTILCVKPVLAVRDISNTTNILLGYRTSAGAHTAATTHDPGATYVWRQRIFVTDAVDAAAWTITRLDSLEVSVIHNQSQARELRCTVMCAMVEYEPPVVVAKAPLPPVDHHRPRFLTRRRSV